MEKYIPRKHAREVALNARHPFLSFRNEIDDLFSSWLSTPSEVSQQVKSASFVPKLDVVEDDQKYLVSAELPGLSEDDIDITIDEDLLTIRGEKKSEIEKEEKNRYYCERSYGVFERRLQLHDQIDSEAIDAKFSKGILEITLPKLAEEQRRTRKVSVRSE